jgi:hypothetical protein
VIEFEETISLVKESVGKAEIKVVRVNGADGRVSVHYRTKDIDAIAKRDYERTSSRSFCWIDHVTFVAQLSIANWYLNMVKFPKSSPFQSSTI